MNDLSFEEAKGQLPWTPKGELLLHNFNALINNRGGAKQLAKDIEKEFPEAFGLPRIPTTEERFKHYTLNRRHRLFTKADDRVIIANYNTLTYPEIGRLLGRPSTSVFSRLKAMGLRKNLTKGGNKQAA